MRREEKITKSHASGVVTLIFIVLFIQGVLFLFREDEKEPETAIKESSQAKDDSVSVIEKKFDPNKIDKNGLVELGLSPKQAQVVVNYREKGGRFKKAEDFSKMYVVSPNTYERVKSNIAIEIEDNKPDTIKEKEEYMPRTITRKRELLPLNVADSADLVSLPGIGPYYARKIIQYRDRLGGFVIKEQLMEIYGIDRERYDLFAERIVVDTNNVAQIDFKEATFEQLSRNPYLGGYVARAIIRYRESRGADMTDLANLVMNNIIRKELYKILKYYFK